MVPYLLMYFPMASVEDSLLCDKTHLVYRMFFVCFGGWDGLWCSGCFFQTLVMDYLVVMQTDIGWWLHCAISPLMHMTLWFYIIVPEPLVYSNYFRTTKINLNFLPFFYIEWAKDDILRPGKPGAFIQVVNTMATDDLPACAVRSSVSMALI